MDPRKILTLGILCFAASVVAVITALLLYGTGFRYPPGPVVSEMPVQKPVSGQEPWVYEGAKVTPLAHFWVRGRVISTRRYWFSAEAKYSPVDFVLTWGPMSDTAVLEQLDITHAFRYQFYGWSGAQPPLPKKVMNDHIANMHMVPATEEVEDKLGDVDEEDIVTIEGYLIKIERSDGWHWSSSLSRKDSGKGACELMWVENVSTGRPERRRM